MGSGIWSTDVYDAADRYRRATGPARSRTATAAPAPSTRHSTRGCRQRESRDSDEHPRSVAIAVLFDVTGSMGPCPGPCRPSCRSCSACCCARATSSDPQIMFGAIGDATCDRVPLQVGQFESDNRMDDDLGRSCSRAAAAGR